MSTMRIFHCDCGHKMRFGARDCGRCHAPTRVYNRNMFAFTVGWLLLATAVLIVAIL